tara:strand:+ start:6567 stop:6743 length:177 start_codon:yes stop_codon:yes gene_type:complete
MAFYRALIKCYVGNTLRLADEEFEYNGPDNTNLELITGGEAQVEDTPKPKRAAKPKAE